mgnify:CR=1 FL=1
MKKLLILSGKDEVHAEAIAGKILNMGGEAFCFRVDLYPFEYFIRYENGLCSFGSGSKEFELNSSWSIWNKRRVAPTFPDGFPIEFKKTVAYETEKTLDGLLLNHAGLVVNNPQSDFFAANKPHQLEIAKKHGLQVPQTIITNNPASAAKFRKKVGDVVLKQQQMPIIENYTMHTTLIMRQDELPTSNIQNCPIVLQELLDKKYELRIIVMGKSIMPFAIYTAGTAGTTDLKRGRYWEYKHEKVNIPHNLKHGITAMMQYYGLHYGAFDFVKTPQNKYYFLELNPRGQFLWLEHMTGFDLTKKFTEYLTK